MRTPVRGAYDEGDVAAKLVGLVVALAGALRDSGVAVATGEVVDALVALDAVGPRRRDVVRAALAATLIKDSAHEAPFERVFARLFPRWTAAASGSGPIGSWSASPSDRPTADARPAGEPDRAHHTHPLGDDVDELRAALAAALRRRDDATVTLLLELAVRQWAGLGGPSGGERHRLNRVLRRLDLGALLALMSEFDPQRSDLERRLGTAEAIERIEEVRALLERLVAERAAIADGLDRSPGPVHGATDLADRPILLAGPDEILAMRAAIRPLARRIATRLGRRHRRDRGRLDMRRTLRQSMSSGGVPLKPRLRRRAPTKPDLTILCDVSGSIAQFAPFALTLVHALHEEFRRVRSWVFVDGIVEITDVVASARGSFDARRLLDRRGLIAGDGRSDYARAFTSFMAGWSGVVTGKTTVLIVGDARSHHRTVPVESMVELSRQGRRLYWLNPEPRREWDTGDSAMSAYARHCTGVFEVSTLRQLSVCVAAIAG